MIEIWPGVAPGSEEWTHHEETYADPSDGGVRIRNVVTPALTPVLPDGAANGTAVIVAPGGGFRFLGWDYEGTQVAEWLAERGFTAFVLKYRLVDTGPRLDDFRAHFAAWFRSLFNEELTAARPVRERDLDPVVSLAIADGEQAVRILRARAVEWSVDPERIGFLGFSAGAFVTAGVAVAADPAARPNFVAPIYGGSAPDDVPADAPPMFSVVAADDGLCFDTSVELAEAWRRAGLPVDQHVFSKGGHGFGINKLGLPVDVWLDLFVDWVRSLA